MHNAPKEIREIVIKRLLELLQNKLYQKDTALAEEFVQKLSVLDFSEVSDGNSLSGDSKINVSEALSEILSQLNDELVSRNLTPILIGESTCK